MVRTPQSQICVMAIALLVVPEFHDQTDGIKGHYINRVDKERTQRDSAAQWIQNNSVKDTKESDASGPPGGGSF